MRGKETFHHFVPSTFTFYFTYATSFMVLGLERAQQLLERHSELMAYLIYDDGHGDIAVWFSPSLRNKIEE